MIPYTMIRSKRKTLALYIKGGGVEVRAPLKMPKRDIDRFVASKERWIADKLAKSTEQAARRGNFSLNYGSAVLVQGREYPIIAKDVNRAGFDGKSLYLPPGLPPEGIKQAVIQVYRMIAKKLLTDRIIDYAERTGVNPTTVKINGAKTRWGSCSAQNSINFSWRLIMASDDVIDYVVVHELMHIKEHNHSDRFWALVASELPDYKKRQSKLKELQRRLTGEDWDG